MQTSNILCGISKVVVGRITGGKGNIYGLSQPNLLCAPEEICFENTWHSLYNLINSQGKKFSLQKYFHELWGSVMSGRDD